MKKYNTVKLRQVNNSDFRFLYQLLSERDPIVNISHRKMPTYDEHIRFIKSKPYTKWYIIYFKGKKSGSVYLSKQDEVGIFLKKEMHGKGIGSAAIMSLMEKNPRTRFLANVSPKNKKSEAFFKKNGFTLIQHTFELEQKKQ